MTIELESMLPEPVDFYLEIQGTYKLSEDFVML
jgi:hypothetical protein